jgi:hypothetical protein
VQHCTQRLALANAYPAELDLLAQALGLPYRKDPVARKAMLAVSRPKAQHKRKATTIPTWDEDPAKLQLVYERCKLDVITTRAVWQSPKLKHLSITERCYQLQDAVIPPRPWVISTFAPDAPAPNFAPDWNKPPTEPI